MQNTSDTTRSSEQEQAQKMQALHDVISNAERTIQSAKAMLLQLDWNEKQEICRIIFDEGLKRAFRFPKNFGIDFLNMLSQLEHRIFWLDVESLRRVLEESLTQEGAGLVNMNLAVYGRICSKVLAPLENPTCNGIRNKRCLSGY